MRKILTTAILSAAILGMPPVLPAQTAPAPMATPATQPAAADVPVKEVVLFSSGVGYFEHFGTVTGNGTTELRFKTNQINDILKSLVLQDLDGGKVTAVTYPSQDPIAKTLKSFQVDITANPPLADLLNQLRGAAVTLTSNGEKITGVILGIEKKKKPVGDKGEVVEQAVLNLVSGGKIISQPLDGVNSIQLDDPELQDELTKALTALAGARDQDKKPVQIHFAGNGERRIRLGYVVETPIWKTSYRLILGGSDDNAATSKPAGDGNLQGWAIVENQTDNDWNNVQLSLVSGRPISFIEDLYQPLYVPRPVVEPELFASLRPQTYAGGMNVAAKDMTHFGLNDRDAAAAPAGAANQMAEAQLGKQLTQHGLGLRQAQNNLAFGNGRSNAEVEKATLDATSSIASLASAAKVGELFQYTVGNVSLPRQRSAMIPIITDPVEIERLSIYNASVMPRNPLNGARLKNTTKKHLLAGPITVIDGATYAGDAQIDNLPPGQERLLSYGIDLQMTVDAKDNKTENQLQTGKIVKGVLDISRKIVQTQDYISENKSDHEKTLIIEHPRQPDWKLVDTDKPIETTDAVYRFKGKIAAGKTSKLTVKEEIVQDETMAILQTDAGQLDFYFKANEIPKEVKDALGKAIQMKQALADTQRQIEEAKTKLSAISAEQNRIRENLRTVIQSSQYYTRLMTKLNDQETQIEKTQGDMDTLQKQMTTQRQDLETYLANLSVG